MQLLSPSASPEKVWLYAAELDEHSLAAAHSDFYAVAVRQHAQSARSLVSWNPEYHQFRIHSTGDRARTNHAGDAGNTLLCNERRRPSGQRQNRAEAKPNDAKNTDVLPNIR
ncbi:hypothetical protein H7J83_15160 [Mycobacterium mantenii]|uniref:hypothetical protein n=1 Tax=Mycobacterium mantenii TaxID=560555 RepID=UPI0011524110|nr:hypothetical protein [Mycobacterium mantenii]MCV7244058.1 hypothetical protein [Mycobacterium mantenii]